MAKPTDLDADSTTYFSQRAATCKLKVRERGKPRCRTRTRTIPKSSCFILDVLASAWLLLVLVHVVSIATCTKAGDSTIRVQ